ncbi:hypothetical protein GOBAR_DD35755 [Gossypium barbadense]|nr:hypothetical protein GOBAR_DD35755 [Gossypium barbadense]
MDVLPSLLHPVPFGVRGGPQSCLVSRVRPLKSAWPRRCTGARSCFRMRKIADVAEECYLVDPASSHMLVSKIKPCMFKKLVVGLRGGSAGPPHGEHRSARPYCRRCAPGLNWPGRSSGAVTLKKLECSKQAYAYTVLVSTINDADQGSADVAFRTRLAPYEKSKSLSSGGSMVARLKLKGIDGRHHQEWSLWLNLTQHGETYQVQT